LNPSTSITSIAEVLPYIDLVLIMSVNPGFGGQSYIPSSTDKISRMRKMINNFGKSDIDLEVDGGIKLHNIAEIAAAGANVIVAGSAIFNQNASIAENIAQLRQGISA
ncbi:MAG: ribulose-phosphate 3-epimerase, partial [Chloroflexota bacterium]